MSKIRRFFALSAVVAFLAIWLLPNFAAAAGNPVFYFFYSPTCSVCAREKELIDRLESQYPELTVKRIDVTKKENYEQLKTFYDKYAVPAEKQGMTPVTFIEAEGVGGKYLVGYNENLDASLEDYIGQLVALEEQPLPDGQSDLAPTATTTATDIIATTSVSANFILPFFGEIDLNGFSPLLLSIIVGILDGFNACAMVALGFLLALIIGGVGVSRKRVLLIGGTFIFVSGLVYFLFVSAWLNLFVFLGYLKIITVIVGITVIMFAIFLIKDYLYGIVCKICDVKEGEEGLLTKWQRKLFGFMAKATDAQMPILFTLAAVVLVAAGINMIELFCSFGFPVAYTKVLTGLNLPIWSYYSYILVYILFYMLDDFLIFLVAAVTLRVTKAGDKYLKAVKLISGVILLLMGIIILFRPELLAMK